MGNCLPCHRRGGRRRRGQRRRNNRVDTDPSADQEHVEIDVVLSKGSLPTRRPASKEEAKMDKQLKEAGPASVAFVIGSNNNVEDYNPELKAAINGISFALEKDEGHYTKEESCLIEEIIAESDLKEQKDQLEKKMKEAALRREKLLLKKARKAKHLAERELPSNFDSATTECTEGAAVEMQPSISGQYTKEENCLIDDIVAESNLKEQKAQMENKMKEAELRREKLLLKKARKAKRLAERELASDIDSATKECTEGAAVEMQPTTSVFTKEEEDIMAEILNDDDMKEKKDAMHIKMVQAEARREKILQRKAKKAKKMAKSGSDSNQDKCSLPKTPPNVVKDDVAEVLEEITSKVKDEEKVLPVSAQFSTEEELMMLDILGVFDEGDSHGRIGQG